MLTKITFGYLKHSGMTEIIQVRNATLPPGYPWLRVSVKKKIKEVKAETWSWGKRVFIETIQMKTSSDFKVILWLIRNHRGKVILEFFLK